jgi:hypothetical protein
VAASDATKGAVPETARLATDPIKMMSTASNAVASPRKRFLPTRTKKNQREIDDDSPEAHLTHRQVIGDGTDTPNASSMNRPISCMSSQESQKPVRSADKTDDRRRRFR